MQNTRSQLTNFIKSRPYLIWYVKNYQKLSAESIVEHTLNYGDWDDVQKLLSILGIKKTTSIFNKQIDRQRINYRPEVINYFKLYFAHKNKLMKV
ncbi:MAG: hypothetical protein ACD_58C00120G0006 [uncultured bacterium]|nr:MAG: hypothetical protein ACD_58C00120G0006 [uncultured bacterium]